VQQSTQQVRQGGSDGLETARAFRSKRFMWFGREVDFIHSSLNGILLNSATSETLSFRGAFGQGSLAVTASNQMFRH